MQQFKLLVATLLSFCACVAQASVVFENTPNHITGNCVFSTNCAAAAGAGNDYAAQRFTLAQATTLTGASFTVYTNSNAPSAANWMFLADSANAPGAVLASGSAAIGTRTVVGADFGFNLVKEGFALGGVTLGAGSYYFAVQAVSSVFETYLASADGDGAFETHNGGSSWSAHFAGYDAVAVSLSAPDAAQAQVPEPGMIALLGLGLFGLGMARRRKA
jgi:hypothetical protein